MGSSAVSNIFNKWKRRKKKDKPATDTKSSDSFQIVQGSGISDNPSHKITEKISDLSRLLEDMRNLGLELAGLKKFTVSLHKLAVSSGVPTKTLIAIIKEISGLCDGREISLPQASLYIEKLAQRQKTILKALDDLEKKKQTLETELAVKKLEHATADETLTEFVHFRQQLRQYDLSVTEIPKLITLIDSAKLVGYNSSEIINTIAELKSKEDRKRQMDSEIEDLQGSRRKLQEILLSLDHEISAKQHVVKATEELKKLGFDFKELEALHASIRMISQTRNINMSAARDQLVADLESYYPNDHELRKRIHILESPLREKEDKFNMLEADYQNEKAVLDNARRLISLGLNDEWLKKLRTFLDDYGIDFDVLTRELAKYQGLRASIDELQNVKNALEEEERLLRQRQLL